MKMAKIGSANTYVRCLKELHLWNYIRYEPSYNRHKGSMVYLYTFDNSTDNASVMPVRPSINNINIVNKENLIEQAQNFESKNLDMKRTCLRRNTNTNENSKHGVPYDLKKTNYLRMKSNEEEKEKFRQKKKNEETNTSCSIPPPLEHIKIYFDEKNFPAVEAEKFFNYFESNGWLVGGRAKMKDWKAAARNWILNIPKFSHKPKPSQPNTSQSNIPKNYGEPL